MMTYHLLRSERSEELSGEKLNRLFQIPYSYLTVSSHCPIIIKHVTVHNISACQKL
jgi:hypothetical protein